MSMWRLGMNLSSNRMTWEMYNEKCGPKLYRQRESELRVPPDKSLTDENREFASLIDAVLSDNANGPVNRTEKMRISLRALQAAQNIANVQPNLTTSTAKVFRDSLRRYKRNGMMNMAKVSWKDIAMLNLLDDTPKGLLSSTDSFEIIFDTGCSRTGTGYIEDFVKGSLKPTPHPFKIDGIVGAIEVTQEGLVHYEVLDDNAKVKTIEVPAYYMPGMNVRLLSPQTYFKYLRNSGHDPQEKSEMSVRGNSLTMTWPDGEKLTIKYDATCLPRARAYHNAHATANSLSLLGCVSDETNQNLSNNQRQMLRWHFRLGHLGFQWVQWLAKQGFLGENFIQMGRATFAVPKCATCLFGKQARTANPAKHQTKEPIGALTKIKLVPGQLIFTDQFESRVPGRAFTTTGLPNSNVLYTGGTIFIDAASGFVHVSPQVGQTAAETIDSKHRFERDAASSGVIVQAYHSDNGIYKSKEFMAALVDKNQTIKFSGVSAQFQNGVAESNIKTIIRNARTYLLHVALRWPGFAEKNLWPMAVAHAVQMYNITPRQDTGLSPASIFTGSIQDPHVLCNTHPWGCPVQVLEPKLKDGQKIPKWQPRARRGQYMGKSTLHASTVGMVRNLQTGTITPQFHTVFDDFFETVHSSSDEEPTSWPELFKERRFQSNRNWTMNGWMQRNCCNGKMMNCV